MVSAFIRKVFSGGAIQPRAELFNQEMVNFFNTFGFLKVPGFFKPELKMISDEFDRLMAEKFPDTSEKRAYLYPQFVDYSDVLPNLLLLPKMKELVTGLMGEGFTYKGSDGNIFSTSTPWHRDYLIRTRSCKMLIYLEPNNETNGALRVIPGSQFVDDKYSSLLGQALTWPEPPVLGGFDEKAFFGAGHNPLIYQCNDMIPQTVVTNQPGDVIIFNHNLIHCTNRPKGNRRRRLLGLHFTAKLANKVNRDEIQGLSLIEMEAFKLKSLFGPKITEHPSPEIQAMIAPLRDVAWNSAESFDGRYGSHSESSLAFCGRLKPKVQFDDISAN